MEKTYDVVVVGARCAGAATAMLLARNGLDVVAVDRAEFPSDTVSTHNLDQRGCLLLHRWGLLDELAGSGAPGFDGMLVHVAGQTMKDPSRPLDGVPLTYAPRRTVLDAILVQAARSAGAQIREGFSVRDVLVEDGRAVGVVGGSVDEPVTIRARVVIGADGKRSGVARAVGAAITDHRPSNNCGYYAYWEGLDASCPEVFVGQLGDTVDRQIIIFPTHGGQANVMVARTTDGWADFKADPEGEYDAQVQLFPELAERLGRARRVSRFFGAGDLDGFVRTASGPGWAVVGDAGQHKDPTPGRGMGDAFVQAELLAAALGGHVEDPARVDEALTHFAADRDALLMPGFDATAGIAAYDYGLDGMGERFGAAAAAFGLELDTVIGWS